MSVASVNVKGQSQKQESEINSCYSNKKNKKTHANNLWYDLKNPNDSKNDLTENFE